MTKITVTPPQKAKAVEYRELLSGEYFRFAEGDEYRVNLKLGTVAFDLEMDKQQSVDQKTSVYRVPKGTKITIEIE